MKAARDDDEQDQRRPNGVHASHQHRAGAQKALPPEPTQALDDLAVNPLARSWCSLEVAANGKNSYERRDVGDRIDEERNRSS